MSKTEIGFDKQGKKDQTMEKPETATKSDDHEDVLFQEDEPVETPTEVFGKHEPTEFDKEMAVATATSEAGDEAKTDQPQAPLVRRTVVSVPIVIGLLGGAVAIQVWLIQGELLIGAAIFATSAVGGILWNKFYPRT